MPDDLTKRRPHDMTRINVNESWELSYWCQELNVTPQQLRDAVAKVGVMVSDVRRYLGR